ncbi:MAG: hypothetical protein ACTSRZ_21080 [Promethearchaeota archaeon]
MFQYMPKAFYENNVANILEQIRYHYGMLTRKGYIHGLIAIDQNAKIIAIDPRFDKNINYWDLSSIGAALYGVARQAQDFFESESLVRATLIYNNLKLFVKSIGKIQIPGKDNREILILLLVSNEVNIGVLVLQMNKFAPKLKKIIMEDKNILNKLKMTEEELKEHIRQLKNKTFQSISITPMER